MRRFALLCLVSAILAPGALGAERHISGFPFVFEHRWGERDDGTHFDRWRALAGIWNTERLNYSDGTEGRRVWLTPLFEYSINVDGFTEWSLLWPAPLLRHRWGTDHQGWRRDEFQALLWLWRWSSEERLGESRENLSLFPLLGHSARRTVTAGQVSRETVSWRTILSAWGRSEHGWWWMAPFPIPLAAQARGEDDLHYQFPWIRYDTGPPSSRSRGWAVIPFAWSENERRGNRLDRIRWFFPLWRSESASGERTVERTWVLPPAFRHEEWSDRRESERGAGEHHWVDAGVFPVTWGTRDGVRDSLRVWPLVFWRPRSFVLFPFVWWADRSDGVRMMIVAPFYGRREYDHERETPPRPPERLWTLRSELELIMAPLWVHTSEVTSGEITYEQSNVLWPLIAWGEGTRRHHWRVFPFAWSTRREWEWAPRHSTTHQVNDQHAGGLFPLYWRHRRWTDGSLDRSSDVVFPFYWDFLRRPSPEDPGIRSERRRRGVIPLWFSERVGGELRRLSVLWPLIQMRWRETGSGETEQPAFSMRFAWLLGGYERWEDGDRLIELLGGPLYQREVEGGRTQRRLLGVRWGDRME